MSAPNSFVPTLTCVPRPLSVEQRMRAAELALKLNPANGALVNRLRATIPGFAPGPERIAMLTKAYWPSHAVELGVGFMSNCPTVMQARILAHMNAWSKSARVKFTIAKTKPEVRIAFVGGNDGGYWSYVGTEILAIPKDEPTMNLEGFDFGMPLSEYKRVVRHETGHTMGFVHEHMRAELVKLIDVNRAIEYFGRTQGWSPDEVRHQVLTPIGEGSVKGTAHADERSIMCYQLPGSITRNGQPILGGNDIDKSDYAFAGMMYPKAAKAAARKKPAKKTAKKVAARRKG